jgi:hypothetical protein
LITGIITGNVTTIIAENKSIVNTVLAIVMIQFHWFLTKLLINKGTWNCHQRAAQKAWHKS